VSNDVKFLLIFYTNLNYSIQNLHSVNVIGWEERVQNNLFCVDIDVKIKNHGLGQYGAKLHYSTLLFWQLCAFKG